MRRSVKEEIILVPIKMTSILLCSLVITLISTELTKFIILKVELFTAAHLVNLGSTGCLNRNLEQLFGT